jgi:hypothetical protein
VRKVQLQILRQEAPTAAALRVDTVAVAPPPPDGPPPVRAAPQEAARGRPRGPRPARPSCGPEGSRRHLIGLGGMGRTGHGDRATGSPDGGGARPLPGRIRLGAPGDLPRRRRRPGVGEASPSSGGRSGPGGTAASCWSGQPGQLLDQPDRRAFWRPRGAIDRLRV